MHRRVFASAALSLFVVLPLLAQQPAPPPAHSRRRPSDPAADGDLPRRGQLRRDRCDRHRRAGQLRPRPHEGRLRGRRGRQAAGPVGAVAGRHSRSSGPTRRSSADHHRAGRAQQHQGVQRPRVRAGARRPSDALRAAASGSAQAAKQFVERYLGANDIAAIVETGARKDGAQEFTSNHTLLLKAINNFAGQKIRSATLDKIDDYYMQREYESRGGAARFERGRARLQGAQHAGRRCARLPTTSPVSAAAARRSSTSARASTTTSRTRSQNRFASDVRDEMLAAIAAATRANVSFYGVDPRGLSGLSDEGDRDHRRCPTTRRSASGSRRSTTSCADRRTACGRSPKRPADSRPSTATTSVRPSAASSRTTAAITCSGTTRPTPGATAGSGSIASPRQAAGPDRPGAQAATSRPRARRRRRRRGQQSHFAGPARSARQPDSDQRPCPERVRGAVQGSCAERLDCADARNRGAAPVLRQRERALRGRRRDQRDRGRQRRQDQGRRPGRRAAPAQAADPGDRVSQQASGSRGGSSCRRATIQLRVGVRDGGSGATGSVLYDLAVPDFPRTRCR